MLKIIFLFISCSLIFLFINFSLFAKEKKIFLASTTSTYDSGLLPYLNEIFSEKYNITIQVLALGTGQALRAAQDGNVEIVLVHHTPSEINFMEKGYGLIRYNLMYNDYVIVGPNDDMFGCQSIKSKLKYIYENRLTFISRGDDSGTHKKELELWNTNNLFPDRFKSWYLNIGQGMGSVLLMANNKKAYTLSDRGTWISFNRKNNLKVICENLPPLINQYGIIIVNPLLNNNLNIREAKIYVGWLLSNEGKNLINGFRKKDKQLFFFNNY